MKDGENQVEREHVRVEQGEMITMNTEHSLSGTWRKTLRHFLAYIGQLQNHHFFTMTCVCSPLLLR